MWFETKIGKEQLLLDAADIFALMSRGPKETDVYCTSFPEGITVDHSFSEIVDVLEQMMEEIQPKEEANETA